MSGKFGLTVAASLLSLMLAACGGDDSSTPLAGPGDTDGTPGEDQGGDDGQIAIGAVNLLSNSPQISTAANSQTILTATVQDNNGVLVPEAPVRFSTPGGSASLQVLNSVTDESGSAQAILRNGDPRNRTITVSASSGERSDSIGVQATGTSISISGPSALPIGGTADYTVRLTDSAGQGISGEAISISDSGANTLSLASDTTSPTGTVSLNFTADTGGTDTIQVSAYSGTSRVQATTDVQVDQDSFAFNDPDPNEVETVDLGATETLTVVLTSDGNPISGETVNFGATRGALSAQQVVTNGSGEASTDISSTTAGPSVITATTSGGLSAARDIEFVATNPTSLIVQSDKVQLRPQEETGITAVLRDAQSNLVKGQLVTFNIQTDESNGQLLESQVTTDSLGRATVTYRAGNSSTGSGGVVIGAETSAGTQPFDSIDLTVGGQALRITLGTGIELREILSDTSYARDWVAFVTDVSGAPVSGANIELELLPISYGKGQFVATDTTGNGEPDRWVANRTATCTAEDINNGNGIIDPGEDANNNGTLEPSNDATFDSSTLSSANDGSAEFALLYPKSNCAWADFRLTATVEVAGSESQATAEFTLSCLADDLGDLEISPPGGTESKYGSAATCADPD